MHWRWRGVLIILSGLIAVAAFIVALVSTLPIWAWALLALTFGVGAAGFVTLLPSPWKTKAVAGSAAAALAAIGVFTALTTHATSGPGSKLPSCSDVGNSSSEVKDTTYYGAFRLAYDRAGGRNA